MVFPDGWASGPPAPAEQELLGVFGLREAPRAGFLERQVPEPPSEQQPHGAGHLP
jgi:hypothetical protein